MRGRRILAAILAIAQVATCSSIVQAEEIASSLSATSVPTAQYYVTVPESINLGEISTEKETTTKYAIDVEIIDGVGGSVKIESSNVMLSNSKKEGETFVAYNSLEKVQVSKSTEVEGIWTVYPDDVKGISAGQYEGTANFVITYSRETPEGETVPLPDKDDTTSTIPPVVPDSGNSGSGNSGSGSTGSGSTGSGSTSSGSTGSGSTSSGSTSSGSSSTSSSTSLSDGKYMADVSMRKETDFSSASMCDALFANQVDITVSGSSALLTMYVIDPIPNYAADGTPLTNISFTYNGKTYSGSVNNSNQELRYFDTASGFIDVAGYYYTSKITVTLPVAALENTGSKTLICNAFVNAVMKTDVSFYVVLSNFVSGETTETTGAASDAGEVFSVLDSLEMESLDLSLEDELNGESDTLNSNGESNNTGTSSMISNLNELADLVSDSKAIRVIFIITMSLVAGITGYSGYIYYRRRKR